MYCEHCGEPTIESAHEPSRAALEAHEPCRLALEMEPPRYCAECRRRMVVQVTPAGWTARCVEHGVLASV